MNITPTHLEALKAFGYTEVEAQFLYLVATHSGYFTPRQFLAFTGAHWGKRTTTFWRKLQSQKHARTECFPKGGVVHHLFSRRPYRLIEKENLRNRREHEFDFMKRCIAILDFVLLNQKYQYLETETEKLRFFCETLNIEKHFLPSSLYLSSKSRVPTIRYFVDKFPMFVVPPSPVVTFTYVHDGTQRFTDFIRHLRRYLPLFRQLSEFRLAYASRADWQFEKATEIFHSFVKIPLESDIADDLLRYFLVRKAWDEKKYREVTEADLIFRNQVRKRFAGGRFEGMYRGRTATSARATSSTRLELITESILSTLHFFYSRQVPKLILTRCHDDVNTNDANDRVVRRAWFDLPNELKWVSASTELSGRRHSYSRGRGATF